LGTVYAHARLDLGPLYASGVIGMTDVCHSAQLFTG
jgi:hypothetical protein